MMNRTPIHWRTILAIVACVVLLFSPAQGIVAAQEAKPTQDPASLVDPTLPQENTDEPADTASDPTQATSTSVQRIDPALTSGAPATLASGIASYNGDDLVWQVQELGVPAINKASSGTSEASIILQRQGESIVRNDVTGKRTLLSIGDAYYIAAGDAYTIMSETGDSVIWKFSLVDPDQVSGNAFYESPAITAVRDGAYDFNILRYVLQPGETADLPANSGAGLVMPGAGEVQVDHGGQLSILGMDGTHGQGQLLRQATSIANTSSAPTVVVYLYLGASVTDASVGTPQNQNTSSGTGNQLTPVTSEENGAGGQQQTTSPNDQTPGGPYVAQINIYGETEIWLSVTVDGVLWFDGTLPQGSWTGPMNGSVFEVYTSSGTNTLFENACGTQFYMGNEPGDAWYTLAADANSCPPPRD